jgi:hypothetical protein
VCELQPHEHVYREGDDPRLTLVLAGSVQVRVPMTRAQRSASLLKQTAPQETAVVPVDEDELLEDDEVATDRDSRIEVGRGVKVESADAHTQSSVVGSGAESTAS